MIARTIRTVTKFTLVSSIICVVSFYVRLFPFFANSWTVVNTAHVIHPDAAIPSVMMTVLTVIGECGCVIFPMPTPNRSSAVAATVARA